MGEPKGVKTNSLSSLLGQYMSDSDNEDVEPAKNSILARAKLNANSSKKETKDVIKTPKTLPTTFWTECLDQSTGHPYYWNIETKEVTWDKPTEYIYYLDRIKSIYSTLPEDSWTVGYSDDSKIPYYVNEITRVVSWDKPANFKDKPVVPEVKQEVSMLQPNKVKSETEKKGKVSRRRQKKERTKKPLPKHLQKTQSDDEKIEVISEYVEASVTSSEEEVAAIKESQGNRNELKNLNLVAAYATDSDSGDESSLKLRKDSKTIATKEISESAAIVSTCEVSSSAADIVPNSFASIITGGKTGDINMDEELNKFKEELEKDLQLAMITESANDDTHEVKEQNFDGKTFQRKRRIEFVGNVKNSLSEDKKDASATKNSCELSATRVPEKVKPQLIAFQKSHVEFDSKTSPGVVLYGPEEQVVDPSSDLVEPPSKQDFRGEIDDLCELLSGKVKFLSVGKPEVSAVQIMSIQLEALQGAFSASCLNSSYFFKWLKTTSDDLQTLEQNAAPEGWECKWDRANSQYCYKNIETNETRWEFPVESSPVAEDVTEAAEDTGKIEKQNDEHDDDAMDICTTPPPPTSPTVVGSCYQWDPGNNIQIQDTSRPADISGELASFYSDIASIDPTASNLLDSETADDFQQGNLQTLDNEDTPSRRAKKRKKVKVPGLASKMQEVSTMVANWQKAQKELGN